MTRRCSRPGLPPRGAIVALLAAAAAAPTAHHFRPAAGATLGLDAEGHVRDWAHARLRASS